MLLEIGLLLFQIQTMLLLLVNMLDLLIVYGLPIKLQLLFLQQTIKVLLKETSLLLDINNGLIIQFLGSRTAMVNGVVTYPIALNAVLSIVTSGWTDSQFFGNDTSNAKYTIATRSHLGANETTLTKCRVNVCHFVLIIGI